MSQENVKVPSVKGMKTAEIESSKQAAGGAVEKIFGQDDVRICTGADPNYFITINKEGVVVLLPLDKADPKQIWNKNMDYGRGEKDSEGMVSFALVNRGTTQAIRPSTAAGPNVELVTFNPIKFDRSILWTNGHNKGENYKAIRKKSDPSLNMDANVGVTDEGNPVFLAESLEKKNQQWLMKNI